MRRNRRRHTRGPDGQHHRQRTRRRGLAGPGVLPRDGLDADTGEVLDAVEALIGQGNADPVTIWEITWTLWDITAFYCPECRLNYCSLDWDVNFAVNPGSHDCILGSCPNGHRHLLG